MKLPHFFAILALSVPVPASAQSLADRVDAAITAGRHADAVVLLREMAATDGLTLRVRYALAGELLETRDYAGALEHANVCVEEARRSTGDLAVALRESCALVADRARRAMPEPVTTPTPVPVVVPTPAPTPARRPLTRTIPGVRSYAPPPGAVVALSVGAASLVTAAVFAGLSASALSACAVDGDRAVCPNTTEIMRARASADYTTGANVALGTGVSLAVAGGAWWILHVALRRPEPVTITVGTDGSIGVSGRF